MSEDVLDTDYIGSITRKWNWVIAALAHKRQQRDDLGIEIKALVVERTELRKLVRLVAPELLNGEQLELFDE